MNNSLIQLLVLAGVAVFLILKLKAVLGTREGFEKPPLPVEGKQKPVFDVIEGGPDHDIIDNVPKGSPAAIALAAMKKAEPSFNVSTFLQGARGAYEMILTAFDRGDISAIMPFLSTEVRESFEAAIKHREDQGLTIELKFIGVSELLLQEATFDSATGVGEIVMRFIGEMTSAVRNKAGEIIEGSTTEIKRQRDIWTFARKMGAADPNWQLVATGD